MKRALLFVITLISSIFLGVEYVAPPEKVFVENTYYQGFANAESPDYRDIYSQVNASSITSRAESSKVAIPLDRNYKPFQPSGTRQFMWLWGLKLSDHYNNGVVIADSFGFLEAKSESNPKGYVKVNVGPDEAYLWDMPQGTKLTAFAQTYLSANEQYLETPYPTTGYSKGVSMSLINSKLDEGLEYRVTYMSMNRWWVDLRKSEPDEFQDGDSSKPLYGHDLTFTENDKFYPGAVIGEVGRTGVAENITNAVVLVRFSKREITESGDPDGEWVTIGLKEFYGLN